ncbi:MAG: hypothetical protein NTZ05_20085 [Chloroflexi bacterium]|nr:hypothetical protein [Chloroflexota bacterium]
MARLLRRPLWLLAFAAALSGLVGMIVMTTGPGATGGLLGTAAAAPFSPFPANPIMVTTSASNRAELFVRSTDTKLWHNWHDAAWNNWTEVANNLKTDAAAGSYNQAMDVVYQAGDGNIWGHEYRNGSWGAYYNLGAPAGGAHPTSAPALAYGGAGDTNVFVRSNDGKLWHRKHTGGGAATGAWAEIASNLVSEPQAVYQLGKQRMTVIYRAGDGNVWGRSSQAGVWQNWDNLGAPGQGAAAGLSIGMSREGDEVMVSVKGGTNGSFSKRRAGTTWGATWDNVGYELTGVPAATTTYSGRYDTMFTGNNSKINGRTMRNGQWGETYDIDRPAAGITPYVAVANKEIGPNVLVVALGADNRFVFRGTSGAAWSSWASVQTGEAGGIPPAPTATPNPPELRIAEHPNLAGTNGLLKTDVSNLSAFAAGFDWNDKISSAEVTPAGAKAALYEHYGWRGKCTTVSGKLADLNGSLVGDNRVSSIRVGSGCEDWYVSNIKVSGSANDATARAGCPTGWTLIPQDLNEGAGGWSVHLCISFGPKSSELTEFSVLDAGQGAKRDGGTPTCGKTIDGNNDVNMDTTNLNSGTNGHFIYFCYKSAVNGWFSNIRDIAFDVRGTVATDFTMECNSFEFTERWGTSRWRKASSPADSWYPSVDVNAGVTFSKFIYPCVRTEE